MTTALNSLRASGFRAAGPDAQQVFRSILGAMSRPTTPQPVAVDLAPPTPLGTTVAAVVLTLCDEHTPLWLDAPLRSNAAVAEWIRFHTGAPVVEDVTKAAFAVASSPATVPALHELDPGTDIAPHTSATLIIDIRDAEPVGAALVATGPGVHGAVTWDGRGAPAELVRYRADRTSAFPQGIDLIFADHDSVFALPRTTHLESLETGSENP
ncbi:phosphonate C-P lyase system protein PhnH [Mycolicibacterium mengxianglii]|uniref:phosphonate C-P lyase system protein PhnH n=1 Tax=Mycolicibacterium mengxianglii TaxID=2736649 RepID=UPI0018D00280|nr:phosphonate C-P lyase system protein PhnH [Mycolicibacterium mengxianglii]